VPTQRSTRQQQAVEKALEHAGRPLSPAEIQEAASEWAPSIGLATVYRAVKRLVESGEAAPVDLPGESTRYETRHAAHRHHHHFHCEDCGRVYDVDACAPGVHDMAPPGFDVTRHEIVLYGSCEACVAEAPADARADHQDPPAEPVT
jgi:Fur family ferric uptake transcriptional regulator